jgi:hypothetical protein
MGAAVNTEAEGAANVMVHSCGAVPIARRCRASRLLSCAADQPIKSRPRLCRERLKKVRSAIKPRAPQSENLKLVPLGKSQHHSRRRSPRSWAVVENEAAKRGFDDKLPKVE